MYQLYQYSETKSNISDRNSCKPPPSDTGMRKQSIREQTTVVRSSLAHKTIGMPSHCGPDANIDQHSVLRARIIHLCKCVITNIRAARKTSPICANELLWYY